MYGAQIALQGMLSQGYGQIFNMHGWGSQGEWSAGMSAYCTSKRAISYFSKALAKEYRQHQVLIGSLSPGMVATDLLISAWQQGDHAHWAKMKTLFKFVIDPAEPVCAYLVDRMCRNTR